MFPESFFRTDPHELVRTMLPNLRNEFRALMPVQDKNCTADIHFQLRKNSLGTILARAKGVAHTLGLRYEDAPYHVIGTTPEIFNDLHAHYSQSPVTEFNERAKGICAQQEALYTAMGTLEQLQDPSCFAETQLFLGRVIQTIVPEKKKAPVCGFGN